MGSSNSCPKDDEHDDGGRDGDGVGGRDRDGEFKMEMAMDMEMHMEKVIRKAPKASC